MYSLTTYGPGDSIFDFNPRVRKIGFRDGNNQYTIAHLLVHGWGVQRSKPECNDPPTGDFETWSREVLSQHSPEERERLPRDPDTKSVHTPWRDQIYYMWNHVLFDVSNWLAGNYGTRRFEPPGVEVFTLEFPTSTFCKNNNNGDGKKKREVMVPAATRAWDIETLLIPAYLAPGVSVRVETLDPGQEDGETFHPGDFTHEDRYSAWYVRKGLELRFYLEGTENTKPEDGLAAVMVYGHMLGEPLEVVDDSEDRDGEDDDDDGDNEGSDNIKNKQ